MGDAGSKAPCVAPSVARDPIEEQILATWRFVLESSDIAVDDNFFKIGGTSLDALDASWRLGEVFGIELPLDMFVESPTVRDLAERIRTQRIGGGWRPIVRLREGAGRSPFFCVHPIDGNVLCYTELAAEMEEGQPFYAFQARGLDANEEPHADFAGMAEDYVDAMRSTQKRGPYYLGGWSVGGLVALEMAQRLRAAGETVALLVLFDTLYPAVSPRRRSWFDRLLRADDAAERRELEQYVLDDPQPAPAAYESVHTLHELYLEQAHSYRPARYDGRITLMMAEAQLDRVQDALKLYRDARVRRLIGRGGKYLRRLERVERMSPLHWRTVASRGFEMHAIPGDHLSMIRGANARHLAARLGECIRQASARG